MYDDHDIQARIRSGGWMVTSGILLMVMSFVGTCAASASKANRGTAAGFEAGQNPLLLLGIAGAVALITLGQVKKSNARREGEERFRKEHFTKTETVLDPDAPGGPFRGATKHVEVLDPVIVAADEAARQADYARGTTNLIIGGVLMGITVLGILWAVMSNTGSVHAQFQRVLMAIGLGFFPFGFGLFFGIKGLLLRSK